MDNYYVYAQVHLLVGQVLFQFQLAINSEKMDVRVGILHCN